MNKYFVYIITLGLIFLTACDPKTFDPQLVVADIVSAAFTSPTSGDAIVMTEADADKTVEFQWSAADYGFSAATTYKVQADLEGGDFSSPISLTSTTNTSVTFTYEDLNGILLTAGIPDGVPTNLLFRIVSDISDEVDEVASETITLAITPYKAAIQFPILAVPGSYQGWNPNDSVNAVFDRALNGEYEGFIFFTGTGVEFKFADPVLGWAQNWGDTGVDGILDDGGDNIAAPAEGMHRMQVNLNDLSYSVETTNWGLIGDATGSWDDDQDMTWNDTERALEVTLDLVAGAIKFRANDDWALNFGDNAANGSLEYNGENIAIADAGNYTIKLFLSDAEYTYRVIKN